MPILLSTRDRAHLVTLHKKLQILRDRTTGVAMGYQSGCIVTGRGGTGKSYTIVEELERLGASYKLTNSHITPRGLFDLLATYPDAIHLIEDAEEISRNPTSLGVLRSALWGSRSNRASRTERLISWQTHTLSLEVVFGGGVILVSNRKLGALPEMEALATRVPCLEINLGDQEIAALMRKVASEGYQRGSLKLDAEECIEVAQFIITESAQLNRALDMRLLVNAFADRLQADDHDAGCDWQDLVYSTLCGRPVVMGDVETAGIRQRNRERELEVARELVGVEPVRRLRIWQERTGKSQATLYRRLSELARADSLDFEN